MELNLTAPGETEEFSVDILVPEFSIGYKAEVNVTGTKKELVVTWRRKLKNELITFVTGQDGKFRPSVLEAEFHPTNQASWINYANSGVEAKEKELVVKIQL